MTTPSDPLADLDPASSTARDASHFRAIVEARQQLGRAEQQLQAEVKAARAAGDSWTVIGAALNVSKQAAEQRFGGRLRVVADRSAPSSAESRSGGSASRATQSAAPSRRVAAETRQVAAKSGGSKTAAKSTGKGKQTRSRRKVLDA